MASRQLRAMASQTKALVSREVPRLSIRAIALPKAMQMPEQLLLLGIHTQDRIAVGPCLAPQGVDVAELLVALLRIHLPGDEFLAQRAAAIAGLLQELRGGVAADLVAALDQFVSQLHGLEIGPANVRVRRATGAVCLQDVFEGFLQAGLALDGPRTSAAAPANAVGITTGAPWRPAAILPHCLQFPNPGVDRPSAHAQDPCDIDDTAETDLQRFDTGIAAPMVLRQ